MLFQPDSSSAYMGLLTTDQANRFLNPDGNNYSTTIGKIKTACGFYFVPDSVDSSNLSWDLMRFNKFFFPDGNNFHYEN